VHAKETQIKTASGYDETHLPRHISQLGNNPRRPNSETTQMANKTKQTAVKTLELRTFLEECIELLQKTSLYALCITVSLSSYNEAWFFDLYKLALCQPYTISAESIH